MVLSSTCYDLWLCCLGTMVDDSNKKIYSIGQKYQVMIVNMLKNWNHKYSILYRIIKYVGFESIIYTINLATTSSSKFFNKFKYMFLSNVLLV